MEGGIANGAPVKGSGISKQYESKRDRYDEQGNVEHGFRLVEIEMKAVGKLCYEQLVHLKREICTEEAGDTEADDNVSHEKHDPTEPNRIKGNAAEQPDKEIQYVSVQNGDGKGQKVSPGKATDGDTENDQDHTLKEIFGYADAEAAPKAGERFGDNEGGGGDHRYAEISLATDGYAKSDENNTEEP